MPLSDKMLKELMATFQAELKEHQSTLNNGLLSDPQIIVCEGDDVHICVFRQPKTANKR